MRGTEEATIGSTPGRRRIQIAAIPMASNATTAATHQERLRSGIMFTALGDEASTS